MSEQSDRIWVQGYTATQGNGYFFDHATDGFDVEYIRADIAAAQLEAASEEGFNRGFEAGKTSQAAMEKWGLVE